MRRPHAKLYLPEKHPWLTAVIVWPNTICLLGVDRLASLWSKFSGFWLRFDNIKIHWEGPLKWQRQRRPLLDLWEQNWQQVAETHLWMFFWFHGQVETILILIIHYFFKLNFLSYFQAYCYYELYAILNTKEEERTVCLGDSNRVKSGQ